MSFVQNGSFEAIAQNLSANTPNTSETNPFGLKDFARMLDNKFGNSAFSDNLLAAPPKQNGNLNPFDKGNWDKPDIGDYYGKGNPYSIKSKSAKAVDNSQKTDNGHSEAYNSAPESIFGGFNKGTGMACGGRSRHKLDFCY